jgi:hypothetical protein
MMLTAPRDDYDMGASKIIGYRSGTTENDERRQLL